MKRLNGLIALGLMALCFETKAEIGVCNLFDEPFRSEIKDKIQSGIPFELMSTLFEEGILVNKKAIHIRFNLWDEIVTLRIGDQTVANFSLLKVNESLCKYLEFNDSIKSGRKYTYRLLLNPLWGERIARLQISTGQEFGGKKLIGIDWRRLSENMPSERVLIEKEIQ